MLRPSNMSMTETMLSVGWHLELKTDSALQSYSYLSIFLIIFSLASISSRVFLLKTPTSG